jgi:RNA polymerase sigma factor (sigma-70 family)
MNRVPRRDVDSSSGGAPAAAEVADDELFAAITAGNLTALGVLYDRHQTSVRRFIFRATAGSADAEDIVHDTFLTAARAAGSYDGRAGARPFLLGIAANITRSRRQKQARWGLAFAALEGALSGIFRRTPEDVADETQRIHLLNVALSRLSEDKRLVILMVELEGLSGEDVAASLGIPIATVWTRLHYARAELREHMKRRMR